MANSFGHDSFLALINEATWGSTVAGTAIDNANVLHLPRGGDSFITGFDTLSPNAIGLIGDAIDHVTPGKIDPKGSVTIEVPYRGAELLWVHAMGGAIASSGLANDGTVATMTYKHVLQINDPMEVAATREGLGLVIQRGAQNNSTFVYPGARVSKMEVSCQKDGFLKLMCELTAKDVIQRNAFVTTSFPGTNDGFFTFVDGGVRIDTGGGSFVTMPIRDLSLTLNNALYTDRFLAGSRLRAKQERGSGKLEATAAFTAEFTDTTIWDAFQNQTAIRWFAKFIGTKIETAGATDYYNVVQFDGSTLASSPNQVRVRKFDVKAEDEGIIKARCEMKFYRDAAQTQARKELQVTLYNKRQTIS